VNFVSRETILQSTAYRLRVEAFLAMEMFHVKQFWWLIQFADPEKPIGSTKHLAHSLCVC